MADQSDVANVLVNLISDALYPNDATHPSVVDGISGIIGVKVFQGWPTAANLNKDLPTGIVYVSVYPLPQEKNTTGTGRDWMESSINPATLTTTVSDNTLTIGGTIAANQTIAAIVNGDDVVYVVQPTDTLETIAIGLATLILDTHLNSVSGSTITIPDAYRILAKVGTTGTSICELHSRLKTFQVTVWASCFDRRDPVASIVEPTLAKLNRILLPDNMFANVFFKSSVQNDANQLQGTYRRDIMIDVNYATTETSQDYAITLTKTSVSNGVSLQDQSDPITTVN